MPYDHVMTATLSSSTRPPIVPTITIELIVHGVRRCAKGSLCQISPSYIGPEASKQVGPGIIQEAALP
jgi:hypothetical protein